MDELVLALASDRWQARRRAAWMLGELGARKALEPLVQALQDRDLRVRRAAAEALGTIGDRRAVPVLCGALAEGYLPVRVRAIQSLGRIRDPAAVDALCDVLIRETDVAASLQAIWALGEMGDARAVPALRSALEHLDPRVREAAVRELGRLDDPAAVEALGELLDAEDVGLRTSAALALGKPGRAEAVAHLCRAVEDEDPRVRWAAVVALGRVGVPAAVGSLCGALHDPNEKVRVHAAKALRSIGDPHAVPALCLAVGDDYVREVALAALEKLVSAAGGPSHSRRRHRAATDGLGAPEVPHLSASRLEPLCGILATGPSEHRLPVARILSGLADLAPCQALRTSLPLLNRLAGFFSGESAEVKQACREAARRIELATSASKSLPRPGESSGAPRPPAHRRRHAGHRQDGVVG